MVSKELLVRAGVVELLTELNTGRSSQSVDMLTDDVSVSVSTVRNRTDELVEEGLLKEDSELLDGKPTRVFLLTDEGEEVAEMLQSVLDEE